MSTSTQDIWQVVEPYLTAEHLQLDDLEVVGQGRGRTVKVVVDKADGVDLDRLAEVSRGLSRLFDAETDLEGPYQLEVTSPGLERPLKRPQHFHKSVGREVVIKTRHGDDQARTVRGILVSADEEEAVVIVDDVDERLAYADIISARTVFRLEPAPKPGKRTER